MFSNGDESSALYRTGVYLQLVVPQSLVLVPNEVRLGLLPVEFGPIFEHLTGLAGSVPGQESCHVLVHI